LAQPPLKSLTLKSLVPLMFLIFVCCTSALGDTYTFGASPTAPSGNNNTASTTYNGGTQQFDLDHHRAYSWQLGGLGVPSGQTITSASISFRNIANWDTNANMLFVHLFDSAGSYVTASGSRTATTNGITSFQDADPSQIPVNAISDNFLPENLGSNPLGVSNGVGQNVLLFQHSFNMVGQNSYVATDFTWNLIG